MQRLVAFGLLVAGVLVQFGLGWGLLAAGLLLWVRDDRAVVWLTGRRDRLVRWAGVAWRRVRTAPRKSTAAGVMAVGLVAAPAGVSMIASIGAAIVAAAFLAIAFSLLLGWGA
jgi:hypothetical protein